MGEGDHLDEGAVDVLAEVMIDFPGDYQASVGWDVGVLQNHVGGVIRSQLGKSKVLFGHENLLYAAVTPGMQGVEAGVDVHLGESVVEPLLVLVAEHGA